MLIPYYFYQKQTETIKRAERYTMLRWLAGPLVMLFAIALWFVPMLLLVEHSNDPALFQYRDNILFKQTVTRYTDSWHHIKPFWYYLIEVIPVFWLPISLALPWLVPHWVKAAKQRDGRIILPLVWILLLLLFFSVSPGKRGVYILPALPMLALICAPYTRSVIEHKTVSWIVWSIVLTLSLALLAFGLAGIAELSFVVKLEDRFGVSPRLFFTAIGATGVAATLIALTQPRWRAWPFFMCILWGYYSTWGYVLLDNVKTPKGVFQNIQNTIDHENITLALVDFSEQFVLFSPYPIVHFGYHTDSEDQKRAAYHWLERANTTKYVLIDKSQVTGECFNAAKAIDLGYAHRTHWVLLSTDGLNENCPLPEKGVSLFRYTSISTGTSRR